LFTLPFEANQILIAEILPASALSGIATSRKILKRQLQLIISSCSTILAFGRDMNNLPLATGLAGARRVDRIEVTKSPVSSKQQERRHAYRHKRSALIKFPPFKCGPSAVDPQYINHTPLFSLIVNLISLITSSILLLKKEGLRISMILLIL